MSATKATIYSILIFLSSSIYFFLAYIGYNEQNIDLNKLNKYTGRVISVGETIRRSTKYSSKVFFVEIEGLNQVLGIYRMNKNYLNLTAQIHRGDTLVVHYQNDNSNKINIDLIQIEKNGRIILEKEEFEKKESALIWIGLIAGILSIFLSIKHYYNHVISKRRKHQLK